MEEKLSVCLFNANAENLTRCVDSLLNQTNFDGKNVELLIYSDEKNWLKELGSTYGTLSIRMLKTDCKSTIKNINALMQLAKNDNVMVLDANCVMTEAALEKALSAAKDCAFLTDSGLNVFLTKIDTVESVGFLRQELNDIYSAIAELSQRISWKKRCKKIDSKELFIISGTHSATEENSGFLSWELTQLNSEKDTVIEAEGADVTEIIVYKNGKETEKARTFQKNVLGEYVNLYEKYMNMHLLTIKGENMVSSKSLKQNDFNMEEIGFSDSIASALATGKKQRKRITAQKPWNAFEK